MTNNIIYRQYLTALAKSDYQGDICDDYASRSVMATDNSVYQFMPQAVLYPKSHKDLETIFQIADYPEYKEIKFSARGGGTGTNGQSLTDGIMICFTKHMNKIISHDIDNKTVTVEPGVILDQLNDYLKPLGYFFAPTLSPSNRATLGGMISTDASGKGSCLYGKTSQHITSLNGVLSNGISFSTLKASTILDKINNDIINICSRYQLDIIQNFPKLLRYMTGYDLAHAYFDNKVNLPGLIAGSEGTLCTITEATLKITALPKYKVLFLVKHKDFNEALKAAQLLNATEPSAVEVIDENIMLLSKKDTIFTELKAILLDDKQAMPGSINLVEYVAHDSNALNHKIENLESILAENKLINTLGYFVTEQTEQMNLLWQLRKRSVELLGKMPEIRRPVSGIEDTVVPPEKLQEYIPALKKTLDKHHLKYGMFGHVDAGCIHVRPALNLTDSRDELLYHQLSNEVAALVKKYGGLIWGEHGKGFRSEYIETFVGKNLYTAFREVKQLFDPDNRLNPGKIAVPINSTEHLYLVKDKKKGTYQRQIPLGQRQNYASSLLCNGNATCLNDNPNVNICPSYKVTKDPVHSPKGRASIINEWLYLRSTPHAKEAIEAESSAYHALEGCLGCKACITQCPVSVNIPNLKAKFYHEYFSKRRRRLLQRILAHSEKTNILLAKFPNISNILLNLNITKFVLNKIGFYDAPDFSPISLKKLAKNNKYLLNNSNYSNKSVCIIVDWITQCYTPELVIATQNLFTQLGFQVHLHSDIKNGKVFHDQGMLETFQDVAKKSIKMLNRIHRKKIPIIGIEPSLTLAFRDEYPALLPHELHANVLLPQEFLATLKINAQPDKRQYYLLSHCSEKSSLEGSEALWVSIFNACGLQLQIIKVGCCGMAGSYGHETKRFENSKKLFEMSWLPAMQEYQMTAENMLVTGFSCREQVKRFTSISPQHPINVLLAHMNKKASTS